MSLHLDVAGNRWWGGRGAVPTHKKKSGPWNTQEKPVGHRAETLSAFSVGRWSKDRGARCPYGASADLVWGIEGTGAPRAHRVRTVTTIQWSKHRCTIPRCTHPDSP